LRFDGQNEALTSRCMVKILVYGAGVIGTLYAARLQEGGNHVTVVARGQRLADIRRYGLALEDIVGHGQSTTQVDTTERLGPDDQYDIALIAVRRDQVASIVPELTANNRIPTLILMLNNPTGSSDLAQALGRDRVLLGFPGAGGTRDGHLVRYAMIAQQPTTLGEFDGKRTPRLRRLVETFRQCGFPTTTSRDMDAWLKAHAFFVTAVSGAIYIAGGDCRRLSEDKATVALMAKGVREGYSAVRALGLSVAPFALKVLFTWLPPTFAIYYWRNFFASKMADYVFGRHARAASQEMRELANDCRSLLEKSRIEAPALRELYRAIDAYVA
jgi:2-dehydropantoate 2-reductase